MLARRAHDRAPRFDQFWPETRAAWRALGMEEGDVGERFGHDVQTIGYLAPAPYPGRREVIAETDKTQDIINAYGETVRYWRGRTGTPEHLAVACDSPTVWYERIKPLMQQAAESAPVDMLRQDYAKGRERDMAITLCGRYAFMAAQSLLGTEGIMTTAQPKRAPSMPPRHGRPMNGSKSLSMADTYCSQAIVEACEVD